MLAAALVACETPNRRYPGPDGQPGVRIVEYAGVPEVEAPFAIAAERCTATEEPGRLRVPGNQRRPPLPGRQRRPGRVERTGRLEPGWRDARRACQAGRGTGRITYVNAIFALGQDSVLMADARLGRVTLFAGG